MRILDYFFFSTALLSMVQLASCLYVRLSTPACNTNHSFQAVSRIVVDNYERRGVSFDDGLRNPPRGVSFKDGLRTPPPFDLEPLLLSLFESPPPLPIFLMFTRIFSPSLML